MKFPAFFPPQSLSVLGRLCNHRVIQLGPPGAALLALIAIHVAATGASNEHFPAPRIETDKTGSVTVSWNGSGVLRRGDSLDGSSDSVASESPHTLDPGDRAFFEVDYQALHYPVVDTHQWAAYDTDGNEIDPSPASGEPLYGQDAHHVENTTSYTSNGDGTVTDEVTGLMWQEVPPEAFYSWTEAQAYAETLNLGGHSDWRMPTMKELLSLADFRGSSRPVIDRPYIDTNVFTVFDPLAVSTFVPASTAGTKRNIDGQFWSSNAYVGRTINNDSATFGFNFVDGRIKGYPNGIESGPTGTAFVRCVRGPTTYGENNYIDNSDGTITDLATGLMWLKTDSGAFPEAGSKGNGTMDWVEALAWAEALEYAGYDDWYLPDAKELHTLVDYTRAPDAEDPAKQTAAIDPIFDLTETESWFWTSTSLGDDLFQWATYICFGRALAVDKRTGLPTTNAHGAGAMRSDPKTGEPADYITIDGGHGPQNDQVRVYNYVRPVRRAFSDEALSTNRPNILFLIVDDWGVDSSALYNDRDDASQASMPRLEKLAQSGVRFTNAFAEPMCSPTRATIITGRYPFRTGVGAPVTAAEALANSEITLPEIFAEAGSAYAVAAFGKWHLTNGKLSSIADAPRTIGGWPHYAGHIGGGVEDYSSWTKVMNGVITEGVTTYPTTDTVNDVIDWTQDQGTAPWFAWVAFNAPHTPFHRPPEELHSYEGLPDEPLGANRRPAYEAALESIDTEVERLIQTVDDGNTVIIVLGDNGTPQGVVQPPFTAGHAKASLFEGGTHVPLVVHGPGFSGPSVREDMVHCVDLFSTILYIAGIVPEAHIPTGIPIDSRSLLPILEGIAVGRDTIFTESFGTNSSAPGVAIRDTRYKLIRYDDGTEYFFDLSTDENEEDDLLAKGPLNDNAQSHYASLEAELGALNITHP